MGSLSESVGLAGEVDAESFRAVLAGRHPITGEQLVIRPGGGDAGRGNADQLAFADDDQLDLPRVASRLRVSVRRVRQLLWAGERRDGTADRYLVGERVPSGGRGRPSWHVRRAEVERYEAASARLRGRPGFDLTLRPPKSVSVLWALAPDAVRSEIRRAHADAVDATIGYLERHAMAARRWHDGRLEPIGVDGVIAAAFDHRTSRAGDPLLHTHVVTANLTRTVDGRWQAIDARRIYENARPAGFLYQAHLRYELSRRLGVKWEGVNNGWAEIDGVPKAVVRAFSKRRDEIEELVAESGYTSARAHQAATLASRQTKERGVDAEALVDRWRDEAAALGFGPAEIDACLFRNAPEPALDVEATFRQLAGPTGLTQHASSFTRKEVVEAIAQAGAATLDAGDIERQTDAFLGSDAVLPLAPTSSAAEWVWRRAGAKERDIDLVRWSTPELVRLEHDVLRWADEGFGTDLPTVADDIVGRALGRHPELSAEQADMVRSMAAARTAIQPIAGRPGSGKTTATAVYVEALHDAGVSVVGCSLAATAAAELEKACDFRGRTGRDASTIARLLNELARQPFAPSTLVIVDEASMVGTRDLHRLAAHVARAGGAMKLVGDPDQHGSVETGGVFRSLVRDGTDVVTLVANNRQVAEPDRKAIEQFRDGNVEAALARYDDGGGVVRSPTSAACHDAMVADWWEHVATGSTDPMIAGTNYVRRQLNRRARARLVEAGLISGPVVSTNHAVEFAAGDWVVARRNDRRLITDEGNSVKNGDAGRVVGVDPDQGCVTVVFDRSGLITLPPWYVAEHVQYAYARTTYGVQGATLDRAFIHVDDRTGFEEAYVAMTRGRLETRLYLVDGTAPNDEDAGHKAHARSDTGLDTVAVAMQRRRAGAMIHDTDPDALAVGRSRGEDLASLLAERRSLESALAAGPPDVATLLHEAIEERDRVRTRSKAFDSARRRPAARVLDERALDRADRRVELLHRRNRTRAEFLAAHAPEVDRLRIVRRSELAREATLRASARLLPPVGLRPNDDSPVTQRAMLDAAESVAVHLERHGRADAHGAGEIESLLGGRPPSGLARMSYERSVALVRAAFSVRDSEPTPTPESDVAPSLFD